MWIWSGARKSGMGIAFVVVIASSGVACGSASTAPSNPTATAPAASPSASATAAANRIPSELRFRWMGGHRDVPGVEPTAGSTILFTEGKFSLTQSNDIEDELLRSSASAPAAGQLRLDLPSSGGGCQKGDPGVYDWSLSSSGRTLTMTAVEDDCPTRLAAVPGVWWQMGCRDPGGDTCLGALDAGTYKSQFIGPRVDPGAEWLSDFGALTYTVPDGWANTGDYPRTLSLMTASDYGKVEGDAPEEDASIFLYTQPVPISQDPPCTDKPEPGVERTVDAEMAWVRQLEGLITTEPMPIVIDGSPGVWMDLSVEPGRQGECDVLEYLLSDEAIAIAGDERQRLILLDLGHGDVLGIRIFTRDPARFDAFVAEAMPIIESFQFE